MLTTKKLLITLLTWHNKTVLKNTRRNTRGCGRNTTRKWCKICLYNVTIASEQKSTVPMFFF